MSHNHLDLRKASFDHKIYSNINKYSGGSSEEFQIFKLTIRKYFDFGNYYLQYSPSLSLSAAKRSPKNQKVRFNNNVVYSNCN
jgi:hypothetical protein